MKSSPKQLWAQIAAKLEKKGRLATGVSAATARWIPALLVRYMMLLTGGAVTALHHWMKESTSSSSGCSGTLGCGGCGGGCGD